MADPKSPEPAPLRAADKIRRTARELFYRDGIRAVGVDEIVARAGVTKPSLYRTYRSKDDLAVAVLQESDEMFWGYFNEAIDAHPGDARAQLLAFFASLAERSIQKDYRGCALSNAAVEYPQKGHIARATAQNHKSKLRQRLRDKARELGVVNPEGLGDALLLLLEGAYLTTQLFDTGRPSAEVGRAAAALIDAYRAAS
jgi:AcrR family transcriptional regulator